MKLSETNQGIINAGLQAHEDYLERELDPANQFHDEGEPDFEEEYQERRLRMWEG